MRLLGHYVAFYEIAVNIVLFITFSVILNPLNTISLLWISIKCMHFFFFNHKYLL